MTKINTLPWAYILAHITAKGKTFINFTSL